MLHGCTFDARQPWIFSHSSRVMSLRARCTDAKNELSGKEASVDSGREMTMRASIFLTCAPRTTPHVCAALRERERTPARLASGGWLR